MIDAVLDTTVIIHLFRRYQPAVQWLINSQLSFGITSITWLEVMEGASNKASQVQCKTLLSQFDLLHLTDVDQNWAMQQLEQLQFTNHVGKEDCLIASVAYRLQLSLYTHNLKDMSPLVGNLATKPYP